ncbi:MAG: carbon-nitrogen family hydrolase [Anaerolineae bacterium]|nr:carbon-nitrogen family hydrolase [Anaerolineae bacterium]
MPILTVSLAQINIKAGNPRANWEKVKEWAVEAARRGSDLVIFPELWDNGYALERAKEVASPLGGGLFAELVNLARTSNVHIAGSILEKRGVGVYNSCPIVSPRSGVMGVYRKIHLFGLMNEPNFLSAGESPLTLDMPWGRTSIAICYDLRFPELLRRYAVEGSKVLLLPAEWPHPRLNHWRTMVQSRAIENQYFMIACNAVGEYNGTTYCGHSMVVDPWGELVAEAGEGETLLTIKVDTDVVDGIRNKIPVLSDRRSNLYGN